MKPGEGALLFEAEDGRTRLTRAAARAPLKLLTPHNHGSARWSFAATYGGGLVDGDAVTLDVRVGPRAKAVLGTQASTKVYRGASRQTLRADVGDGAMLVVMPDPLVPFAGARYEQQATLQLHPGASLVWVDILSCGRAARGERWAFARYASRTRILRGDELVAEDALVLDASEQDVACLMGRFDAFATLIVVGLELAAASSPDVVHASSRHAWGTVVRVAGRSAGAMASFVREALKPVRALLGDDPYARKW